MRYIRWLIIIFRPISIDSNKPISGPAVEEKAKLIELEKAEIGNVCVGF